MNINLQSGDCLNYDKCCLCGNNIDHSHFVVTTRKGKRHSFHTSCAVSGITIIIGGIALLAGLFQKKKKELRNSYE